MDSILPRILAVDDKPHNLAVLKMIVAVAFPGAIVFTALDGPSGLEQARAEDPDVILLDVFMPKMDGFEVCRAIKTDPRLQHIPVVFLTAMGSDPELRVRALETGAEAFLSKPVDGAELTAVIRTMVKLKALHARERREKEDLAALVADRTRELERELAERKQAEKSLQASLREKETLLKEVHHRVKNNLQVVASLLHLQACRVENPGVLEVLKETQNRVRAMALLHETLYGAETLSRLHFPSYLNTLCKQLVLSYGPETSRLGLDLRVADIPLELDQAVPCGLIINELVSNALKHAFPDGRAGQITVELEALAPAGPPPAGAPPGPEPARRLVLRVTDTGVGMPPDFDLARARSLGLQLVLNLARQLRGTACREPGPGTRLAVTFPAQPHSAKPS